MTHFGVTQNCTALKVNRDASNICPMLLSLCASPRYFITARASHAARLESSHCSRHAGCVNTYCAVCACVYVCVLFLTQGLELQSKWRLLEQSRPDDRHNAHLWVHVLSGCFQFIFTVRSRKGGVGENNEVNYTVNGSKHPIEEQEMTNLRVYWTSGTVQLVITVLISPEKDTWMTGLRQVTGLLPWIIDQPIIYSPAYIVRTCFSMRRSEGRVFIRQL